MDDGEGDSGEMSKAAKKNQKKKAKKKSAKPVTKSSGGGRLDASEILPLLKEELELAKRDKDHARAGKIRDQLWVLNDLVAGVRTDIPEDEYQEILKQLPIPTSQSTQEQAPEEPSSGANLTTGEKRIRTLRKKLDQIQSIKDRLSKGEKLEDNQKKKIESEEEIRNEISELEELMRSIL